jgi:hypothetical protein
MYGGEKNCIQGFGVQMLKESYELEDLGIDGRIML